MATSTHCTMTTNCTDTDTGPPLSSPLDPVLFQPNDSINDPNTLDMPGNAYHSSPYTVAAVGGLDSTARPFPCCARRRRCLVRRLGDLFASASLIGQRASRVVGRFTGSCVRRSRLPDECIIRRVTAVKKVIVVLFRLPTVQVTLIVCLTNLLDVIIYRTLSRLTRIAPALSGNAGFCLISSVGHACAL